jgi:RNA polymerase sigma-70 factor (ECF subfamily)
MQTTMSDETSTRDLIRDAQNGLRSAQAVLIERHEAALQVFVERRIGSHLQTHVEAKDVVQETLARALQILSTFEWRGEGSFLRWLKAIASNEILRLAKRERRREFISIELTDEPAGGSSPSRGVRREERFARLESALEGLSPDHREVIVLARIQGLRLAEVAKRMGRSPNAVAQLLGRALSKLKDAFGDTESLSLPPVSFDLTKGERRQDDP